MTSGMKSSLSSQTTGGSDFLSNSSMISTGVCVYEASTSFEACSCGADSVSALSADQSALEARQENKVEGVITKNATSTAGSVMASTTAAMVVTTLVVGVVAAVAATLTGGAGAGGASSAAAVSSPPLTTTGAVSVGTGGIMATIDLCQFGVFLNEINLNGKSAVLSLYGKKMAPAAFVFLPFGKLDKPKSSSHRLVTSDSAVASYSRTLGIDESWLFVVTLAGIATAMAGTIILFGMEEFMENSLRN